MLGQVRQRLYQHINPSGDPGSNQGLLPTVQNNSPAKSRGNPNLLPHQVSPELNNFKRWSEQQLINVKERSNNNVVIVAFLTLFLWHIIELAVSRGYIPSWLPKTLMVFGMGFVYYRLIIFDRWNDEYQYALNFMKYFAILLVILSIENAVVFGVSWSDRRKYDKTVEGLQDNIADFFQHFADQSKFISDVLYYELTHTANQILLVIILAFSPLYNQIPYSGFGIMTRYAICISICRFIRAVCYLAVIIPHPEGFGCYGRRFPPPPDTLIGFLKVAGQSLRGTGGCNDLIVSGHGQVWVVTQLIYGEYVRYTPLTVTLWAAYFQTCLRTALAKHHYSLDMILATVTTTMVWRQLRGVYPPEVPLPKREVTVKDPLPVVMLLFVSFIFLAIGILVFVAHA